MKQTFARWVVRDFLEEENAHRLRDALKQELFSTKESDLFLFEQTPNLKHARGKAVKEFYKYLQSKAFAERVKELTGVAITKGAVDVSGSWYRQGQYLLCHNDKLDGRKIAYIYYLGDDFLKQDGGGLAFYETDEKGQPHAITQVVPPRFNQLVLFEVGTQSYHAVEEVLTSKKERLAISGWGR